MWHPLSRTTSPSKTSEQKVPYIMRITKLEHVATETEPAGAALLSFRSQSPLSFEAGQFGLWIVKGSFRPFTIASAPDDELVQLATRLHDQSAIKRKLGALTPGDQVRIVGPIGSLAQEDENRPIVYIMQGIGVSVARSMIHSGLHQEQMLIHVGAPYFREELESQVTDAIYPADRDAFDASIGDTVARTPGAHFVVAGSSAFVTATARTLSTLGVPKAHIAADSFIGLPNT